MNRLWFGFAAVVIVMGVAGILFGKFREKALIKKYCLRDPSFKGDVWGVSRVRCIKGFLRFVLSHANEGDHVIVEGFSNAAPVEHAGKFGDSVFGGNLILALNEENKARFMEMVEGLMLGADYVRPGPVIMGIKTRVMGELPNRGSAIWNIVDNIYITNEGGWLLVSYDCLTRCWLSGRIQEKAMEAAFLDGVLTYTKG